MFSRIPPFVIAYYFFAVRSKLRKTAFKSQHKYRRELSTTCKEDNQQIHICKYQRDSCSREAVETIKDMFLTDACGKLQVERRFILFYIILYPYILFTIFYYFLAESATILGEIRHHIGWNPPLYRVKTDTMQGGIRHCLRGSEAFQAFWQGLHYISLS